MEETFLKQNLLEKKIVIILSTIENVIRRDDVYVSFVVEHTDNILGECSPIFIRATCEEESAVYDINLVSYLSITEDDRDSLDTIVSTPILIKAFCDTSHEQEEYPTDAENGKKDRSIFTTGSSSPKWELLGICNLDLMPLILGERSYTEKLVLETPTFSYDGSLVSWQNLPLLIATISLDCEPLFQHIEANFLNITVESVYNLPENFTQNSEYKAGTIVYSDSEVPENLFFEHGVWTTYRDVERTKRWNTLANLENRARLSKYKLDCDYQGLKNSFKDQINFEEKVCEDTPRIEWNAVHRCIMWEMGIEAMKNHIRKYKFWPFQFMVVDRNTPEKSKGSSAPTVELYQCYVDLSELLFPGKTSCRVVGQLYTYNAADITAIIGVENNIFILETQSKEVKGKEKRHKTSKHSILSSESETPLNTALTSINEQATVIVIEVELHQPLIPCNISSEFSYLINDLIPKRTKKKLYAYSGDVAEKQYMNCIKKLVEVLTESYRDFCDENKKSNEEKKKKYCYDPKSDELTCFTQYLYRTGTYLALRNTLRSKIILLLDQRFKIPSNLINNSETQNFIASVYTYLVEQMHVAINTVVEGRCTDDFSKTLNVEVLDLFAEEAYELGNLDKARHYYRTAVAESKNDPVLWTKYAIFLKKIGDVERAKHCCLEAISLDRRYVLALLLYAAILFEDKRYKEAEIFLMAITDFHPRFFEGWLILHLFYIRTEYYPGIDLTFRVAEKCMKDKVHPIKLPNEPFAWSTIHCPNDNLYMNTAVFLLKLHLCEFAGIALAEEMSQSDQSLHFLYYMAVEHYLSNRYEDAISHLNKIKCSYGMDYSISSLMGHCYFKIDDNEKAIECYEFARMLFDRPTDLHLVEVRLGYYYYDNGDYERARNIFLSACKSSPTSQTWLGAGLSYYELKEFTEAETALSEANRIDNLNPDIWGCLCLLNITLRRYDEFCQCYREMVKNNLKNRKLWLRITNAMEAVDYAPPILVTEHHDLIENYSEEAFEEQF
ncbi:cilia- and flagella-associated protein 70 [Nomia melanderi]|uniref:cilia- and flagella-associated protein 70 n=1 Tax=Nomia melanderi TaxID=2448451 RepID=UPI0013044039|nr:cilia- and flagella-associated protein 70 [Nomia melanderi]